MNQYLKEICELCGFNDPIHITGFRKGRRYDITVPKYSEISTHCGRKTFICFILSIGIAPQVVMKFTGHADYKSMKPYIDIAEKAKTDAMDAMDKALGKN
jgi:integrase